MQVVQQAEVLFATLFVYDTAGQPTFYTATLVPAASLAWSGDLYRTTGPYFGQPSFDPATVTGRKVGTMMFSRPFLDAGLLQYAVDGTAVSKIVQRQLLRFESYTGVYVAMFNMVTTNCPSQSENGDVTETYAINIVHAGTTMSMHWQQPNGTTCDVIGSYGQQGHVGQLDATYACSSSENGALSFSDLTNRVGMISGRFQGHSANTGCDRRGRFAGLNPD